jgi:hypothetical protein
VVGYGTKINKYLFSYRDRYISTNTNFVRRLWTLSYDFLSLRRINSCLICTRLVKVDRGTE